MSESKTEPNGILVIDKPPGWTSHDVVAKCRGILGTRKIGHSGTLDPDATGVLVLGVGKCTRILQYLTGLPKRYVGEIVLGAETTTLDASGEVTATFDMSSVTLKEVEAAAAQLTGDINQVPPMVSALKVEGRRLHEIAREGREVERQPRPVTVYQFDVIETDHSHIFQCDIRCSTGTYIRSLAADLGKILNGGAHLTNLRRLSVGSFTIEEAHPIEDLVLISPAAGLRDFKEVRVSEEVAIEVSYGKVLEREQLGVNDGSGPWPVLDLQGNLLAVYEPHKAGVKPAVVLVGPS